jgi:hypothetical protein
VLFLLAYPSISQNSTESIQELPLQTKIFEAAFWAAEESLNEAKTGQVRQQPHVPWRKMLVS